MGEELLVQQQKHLSTVSNVINSTADVVEAVLTAARTLNTAQNETLQSAKQQSNSAAEAEIARLRSQNQQLTQLLIDKDTETAKVREDLIAGVTNLIVGVTDAQNTSLRSAIGKIQAGNDAGLREVQAFKVSQSAAIDKGSASMETFGREIATQKEAFEGQRGNGQRALADAERGLQSSLEEYASEASEQARIHVESVEGFCGLITEQAEGLETNVAEKAQEQSETISSLRSNSKESFELSSKRVRAGADDIASLTSTLLDSVSRPSHMHAAKTDEQHATSSEASAQAHRSAKRKIDEISDTTDAFLGSLRRDEPTGDTPRKRTWDIPSWERTGPRETLLRGFGRQCGSPLKRSFSGEEEHDGNVSHASHASAATAVSVGSAVSAASAASAASARSVRSSGSRARSPAEPERNARERPAASLPPLSRTSSQSSLTAVEDPQPLVTSLNGKRPKTKRLDSAELRPQLSVLGEGGNIPRRQRLR